jgi:hypothetical protein
MLKQVLAVGAVALGAFSAAVVPTTAFAVAPVTFTVDCYDNADVDVTHPTTNVPYGADIVLTLDPTGGVGGSNYCTQITPAAPTSPISLTTQTTYTIPAADCSKFATFSVTKDTGMLDYFTLTCEAALPDTGAAPALIGGIAAGGVALLAIGASIMAVAKRRTRTE